MLHNGIIVWQGPAHEIDSTGNPYVVNSCTGAPKGRSGCRFAPHEDPGPVCLPAMWRACAEMGRAVRGLWRLEQHGRGTAASGSAERAGRGRRAPRWPARLRRAARRDRRPASAFDRHRRTRPRLRRRLVPGSTILVGGDPASEKSTLLLQAAASLAAHGADSAYITGEEAIDQVRLRAERLGVADTPVRLASASSVRDIVASLDDGAAPDLVVIDSIQTMYLDTLDSAPAL